MRSRTLPPGVVEWTERLPPTRRGREPDIAGGRPGETLRRGERLREPLHVAGEIHRGDPSAVVARRRVIDEGDQVPIRGDARVADPTVGFVQDFAGGILEPVLAGVHPDDREALPIRRPVGPEDLFQNVAWGGAAGHRELGERSDPLEAGAGGVSVHGDGHFSGLRDREDFGAREAERPRFGTLGPADEDLHGLSVPGRRVDDGLPVRSEPRREDLAAAVCELTEGRRRTVRRAFDGEVARDTADEGGRQD